MSITDKIKLLQKQSSQYVFIPFKNALQPYLILFFVSILVYLNTLNNEVAYDDEIVLHKNEFVQQGIKGIPDILTHDSYYSYYKQLGMENVLPAGRYRPMSFITFAVEQQFIATLPDGIVKKDSWDINQNGVKDQFEDTNKDGLYTDYDYWIKGSSFRHFVNVLLYALLIVLVYHVLIHYVFFKAKDMVFCSVLLFALHPLHTEVVANIKSRDEILSLFFIFLSLLFSFKYLFNQTKQYFICIVISMFFALLSKEYALFLFVFIPAVLFVFYKEQFELKEKKFWLISGLVIISAVALIKFFSTGTLIAVPVLFLYIGYYLAKQSAKSSTRLMFALGTALVLYLSLRFSATQHRVEIAAFEADIISNPYMFASPDQIWASKIAVWLKYLKLFFIPDPLLVDYSFKTIPYSDFSSPWVWLSILIFSFLTVLTAYSFFKRSTFSFPLLLLLGCFLPIANLFIDIGATMGERLFFHSSLGVSILLMMLFFKLVEKITISKKSIVYLLLGIVLTQNSLFAFLTMKRNPDWKNNLTLFTHDVEYASDNLNLIFGASSAYYQLSFLPANKDKKDKYLKRSLELANRGIKIYPKHDQLYFNKALSYLALNQLDSSLINMQIVEKMTPMFPNLHKFKEKLSTQLMITGIVRFEKQDTSTAFNYLTKSVVADSSNTKAWNNLAKAYYETNDIEKAITNYETTLKLDSKNKVALDAIALIRNKKGVNNEDLQVALKQLSNDKKNPDNWCKMGDVLFASGSLDKARACYQSALKLKADHKNAQTGLNKIEALSK